MTPPGARGGLLSAWQWVPCRHGGHAFTLSPLCPPGAEPPCLAGGWGVPPRTLPRRLCCGEGHGKGILHQPHSTGAASLQILENGTPAARGCRREAVLDAEKKPGTPVWQGHCLGPLPPCRGIGPLPQAPRAARRPPGPPCLSRTGVWLRTTPRTEPRAVGRTALHRKH